MGRMYSRKKGKARSTRPLHPTKPTWITYEAKEVEMIIQKLAKEGKNPSMIGLVLRDTYGIPDVRIVLNKSVAQILDEKKMGPKLPEDLLALIQRSVALQKHTANNKQDMTGKRGKQLTESKIGRLVKYYKKIGKLPKDWKYDQESIRKYAE